MNHTLKMITEELRSESQMVRLLKNEDGSTTVVVTKSKKTPTADEVGIIGIDAVAVNVDGKNYLAKLIYSTNTTLLPHTCKLIFENKMPKSGIHFEADILGISLNQFALIKIKKKVNIKEYTEEHKGEYFRFTIQK